MDIDASEDLSIPNLMLSFESIGDNCEFGIAQRYCGIEPLSLFRFTGTPIERLIYALNRDLEDYGDREDTEFSDTSNGLISCSSRRYGISYSTGERIGADLEKLMLKETRKLSYLKRKFKEDIRSGQKIYVRKLSDSDTRLQQENLLAALARYGSPRILFVREAKTKEQVGEISKINDRVMEGYVDHFSPIEDATSVDLISWVKLCKNAYFFEKNAVPGTGKTQNQHLNFVEPNRIKKYTVRKKSDGVSSFRKRIYLSETVEESIYVFSAWIWLPEDTKLAGLFAAIDYGRLAWCSANVDVKTSWQRIWVSARVPTGLGEVKVGLVAHGDAGQKFYSTRWVFEKGLLPSDTASPPIEPGSGLSQWIGLWLNSGT